jgi:argininosuccinate synthase
MLCGNRGLPSRAGASKWGLNVMAEPSKKRVVLAYSGGLDTSVILKWLIERGFEVVCFVGDVGQKDDFDAIRSTALALGASKVYVEDLKREFVTDYVFPAIQANVIYEGRYLLGTSLARPLLAKAQIEIAHKEGAGFVSHGATGKGNDQVRFELAYSALDAEIELVAPWKEPEFLARFKGRSDLLAYAAEHGIPVTTTTERPYSEDANLMHISHEAGILEDPSLPCPEDVYSYTVSPAAAPDEETKIEIQFRDGMPTAVRNITDPDAVVEKTDPLELFTYLCELGSANGIGRVDMVENRFIGVKSRGVYETPGGTILRLAHMDLEAIAMDREVLRIRNMLTPKMAELMYNGFWFSPEMEFLMAAVAKSQEFVDGVVTVSLYKGNVTTLSRTSPTSLYDQDLASMDIEGGFDQQDSFGFIKVNAIRLKAHSAIVKRRALARAAENQRKED